MKPFYCILIWVACTGNTAATDPDLPFTGYIVEIQYSRAIERCSFQKLVIDYNDVVYVLSEKGLYRVQGQELAKDLRLHPVKENPLDIAIQDGPEIYIICLMIKC